MAPAPVVSAPQSHLGTPKPDPVVSNSSADSDGEPVDLGDVVADLKRSGVEVDQKTAAALKKLKGVSINTKEIIDAATGLGLSATRSAIESARKIGVREMAKALKDVQRATEELRRPPPKEPN
jgi:hypothetical protein